MRLTKKQKKTIGFLVLAVIVGGLLFQFSPLTIGDYITYATSSKISETDQYAEFQQTIRVGNDVTGSGTPFSFIVRERDNSDRSHLVSSGNFMAPFMGNDKYPLQEGVWFEAYKVDASITKITGYQTGKQSEITVDNDFIKARCKADYKEPPWVPGCDDFCRIKNAYPNFITCEIYGETPQGVTIRDPEIRVHVRILKDGIQCISGSDCKEEGTTGDNFCLGKNIMQKYKTPLCVSSQCSFSESQKLVESCPDSCLNAECIDAPVITQTSYPSTPPVTQTDSTKTDSYPSTQTTTPSTTSQPEVTPTTTPSTTPQTPMKEVKWGMITLYAILILTGILLLIWLWIILKRR